MQSETDSQFNHAFHRMDAMRQRGLFCDVILVTRNIEIPAHKVILASYSEFFESTFVKMGKEKLLSLGQIDGKTLSILVDYIYTSSIEMEINATSVEDILIGANILQLKNIRNECCKYLENNLNLNTSLKILFIAQNQKYMDLLKKTEEFVDKNIIEIINTREFLNLSVDQLTHLISRDTLEVLSEEKIYEGVISWVKADLTTRTKHLSVLMSHVRLSFISRDYLKKYVINEPLLKTDIQCKDLIIDALLNERIPQMIKPRKGRQPHQILLIMGGDSEEACNTFEMYDFKTNNWSKLYSMPGEKRSCNLAFVNRKLYDVNGDGITEYDLVNNCWCNFIKMNSPRRSDCGVGVLNDSIYVVGGKSALSTVEKFDISSQKWSSIASMSTARYYVGVGILDGFLYAVGGDSPHGLLKSIEFYDPKLNVWKQAPDLITARSSAAIGVLHNKMYVIGGWEEGSVALDSVECYSLATNRFTESAPLNIPRWDSTVVTFDDKLYVIGGMDGDYYLNNMEVYCPKNDEWKLLPATMNVERLCHGAAIIDKVIDF